jgi:hypothetical protein
MRVPQNNINLSLLSILLSIFCYAAPPAGGPPPPTPPPPPGLPIDTSIIFLVILALIYAGYKLKPKIS